MFESLRRFRRRLLIGVISLLARIDPTSDRPYFLRGRLYALDGDDARALADLNRVLELRPELVAARLERAYLHLDGDRPAEAILDADACLRATPDCPETLLARGAALRYAGRAEEALVDLSRALELDPKSAHAAYHRALVLIDAGQTERALSDLLAAWRNGLRDPCVSVLEGECLLAACDFEAALTSFRLAERLSRHDASFRGGKWFAPRLLQGKSRAQFWLRKYREQVADFEAADRADSVDSVVLACAGWAYVGLGRRAIARACFVRAFAADAECRDSATGLVWLRLAAPGTPIEPSEIAAFDLVRLPEPPDAVRRALSRRAKMIVRAAALAAADRFPEAADIVRELIDECEGNVPEFLTFRLDDYRIGVRSSVAFSPLEIE